MQGVQSLRRIVLSIQESFLVPCTFIHVHYVITKFHWPTKSRVDPESLPLNDDQIYFSPSIYCHEMYRTHFLACQVLSQTQDHRHRVLVSAARNIRAWMMKVWKIKSIYHTLNMFNLDVIQNGLIAECWIPVANLEDVQLALRRGTVSSGVALCPLIHPC